MKPTPEQRRIYSARYYQRNRSAILARRQFVEVTCSGCGFTWSKRADTLKSWGGRCNSCAQALVKLQPEMRKQASRLARAQLLRQGGVPNAVQFQRDLHSGSGHPRWEGGIAPVRQQVRSLAEYVTWRTAIFERDDYQCVLCGGTGELNADHFPVAFATLLDELEKWVGTEAVATAAREWAPLWDVENGRTLCIGCHEAHGIRPNRLAEVAHGGHLH